MPSVGKSRKEKWRKAAVQDVVEAHLTAVTVERLGDAQDKKGESLFTIDTQGKLNRKQAKRIAREVKAVKLTPQDIAKEQAWLEQRKKWLTKVEKAKKAKRKAFDLWAEDEGKTKRPRKYAKCTKLFAEVPAVLVAEEGQSVNPTDKGWKETLLAAAAKADVEKERNDILFDAIRPVTAELHLIFPPEIIDTLTDDEQMRLFRIAKDSQELLEEPEDFLARVLPTLRDFKTDDVPEVKQEPEVEASPAAAGSEDAKVPSKGVLAKTTKERNREVRRKLHEAQVELHKQKKLLNKEFASLAECLESLKEESERIQARKEYRQALIEYWTKARARGECVKFRSGKRKFEEPVGDVVGSEIRAVQGGSLRKLPAPAHCSALRDRFASFQRRGMVEVASQLSSEVFRLRKSRFNLAKNRKIRSAQKDFPLTNLARNDDDE